MASFIRTWHCSNTRQFWPSRGKTSHPELLDYLASKFREDGWSIKKMIKFIVTSESFRSSSIPSSKAKEIDPQNLLLSHANLRRIEAEPIRDAMLLTSGRLNLIVLQ